MSSSSSREDVVREHLLVQILLVRLLDLVYFLFDQVLVVCHVVLSCVVVGPAGGESARDDRRTRTRSLTSWQGKFEPVQPVRAAWACAHMRR